MSFAYLKKMINLSYDERQEIIKFNERVNEFIELGYSKVEAMELVDSMELVSNEVVAIDHYEEVESDH